MDLTGRCKVDFEKWFLKESENERSLLTKESKKLIEQQLLNGFYFLGGSSKYGVYVDFFDSVGIEIEISQSERFEGVWCYYFEHQRDYQGNVKTRHEARIEAIKKANEIYNKESTIKDKPSVSLDYVDKDVWNNELGINKE